MAPLGTLEQRFRGVGTRDLNTSAVTAPNLSTIDGFVGCGSVSQDTAASDRSATFGGAANGLWPLERSARERRQTTTRAARATATLPPQKSLGRTFNWREGARHPNEEQRDCAGTVKGVAPMDNPGAAWGIILSNPELREGILREAARSRRSDRALNSGPTLRRWLGVVVRALSSRPKPTAQQDPRPVPVAGVE